MSIRIIKSGLLDTIQDGGRYGNQHNGINPNGAMDMVAMRVANALTGNDPDEAVIEMHFPAASILFEESALIAIAGADFDAEINGEKVPVLQTVWINKNSVLNFAKRITGARVYLSVRGGWMAKNWLGSDSTNLTAATGGFDGRSFQKGDKIPFKKQQPVISITEASFFKLPWKADVSDLYNHSSLRFITGAEYYELTDESKQTLEHLPFKIGTQSNRMGYRLQATPLSLQAPHEMVSAAVTKGTLQLLPDGQLIVLMADHQTTGGYPRIGHLISMDISAMAQLSSGQNFTLQKVDLAVAEELFLSRERNLLQLRNACIFRLQQYLKDEH